MSALFLLHTNEQPNGIVVRSTETILRANMFVYIRAKRRQDYKLQDILYCWSRIYPTNVGPMREEGA